MSVFGTSQNLLFDAALTLAYSPQILPRINSGIVSVFPNELDRILPDGFYRGEFIHSFLKYGKRRGLINLPKEHFAFAARAGALIAQQFYWQSRFMSVIPSNAKLVFFFVAFNL